MQLKSKPNIIRMSITFEFHFSLELTALNAAKSSSCDFVFDVNGILQSAATAVAE